MKRCLASLATREMKSTATIRYNYTPNRKAITKKTDRTDVGEGVEELSYRAGHVAEWSNYFGK